MPEVTKTFDMQYAIVNSPRSRCIRLQIDIDAAFLDEVAKNPEMEFRLTNAQLCAVTGDFLSRFCRANNQ